jgi:hypothetical protein
MVEAMHDDEHDLDLDMGLEFHRRLIAIARNIDDLRADFIAVARNVENALFSRRRDNRGARGRWLSRLHCIVTGGLRRNAKWEKCEQAEKKSVLSEHGSLFRNGCRRSGLQTLKSAQRHEFEKTRFVLASYLDHAILQ